MIGPFATEVDGAEGVSGDGPRLSVGAGSTFMSMTWQFSVTKVSVGADRTLLGR